MADLEHATFLSSFSESPPSGYSRVYFGSEFCYWRLPLARQILEARAWADNARLKFTLVTPVVGEEERLRLDDLLAVVLPELQPGDEVVMSDWGVLESIRSRRDDLEVILGRTLSGQKRGPRTFGMELTEEQDVYFRQGAWHSSAAVALLIEQDIRRIEQDNLIQGLAALPDALCGTLHVPFAMVTSSRNCPFRPAGSAACPAPCGELFTLQAADMDVLLYQDGNTQFLRNDRLPEHPAELGIDRIVHHLHMPRRG